MRNMLKKKMLGRRSTQGFTLIEMVVVILIMAIIAAFALPMYNNAVERSRMGEAFTILSQAKTDVLALQRAGRPIVLAANNAPAGAWFRSAAIGNAGTDPGACPGASTSVARIETVRKGPMDGAFTVAPTPNYIVGIRVCDDGSSVGPVNSAGL